MSIAWLRFFENMYSVSTFWREKNESQFHNRSDSLVHGDRGSKRIKICLCLNETLGGGITIELIIPGLYPLSSGL